MPVQRCTLEGKPGWSFGAGGTCYTYPEGDDAAELAAKKKAIAQGLAIGGGKPPAEGLAELYRLADVEAGKPSPMMLFPIGDWTSDKYPDLSLKQELADEVIANFEANVLRTKVPVDTNHDQKSPANGWIDRLYMAPYEWQGLSGEALYADWTPNELGAGLVNDGQFAYDSIDLADFYTDPATGATYENVLKAVSLANRPVLRMMPGVRDAGDAMKLAEPRTFHLSEFTAAEAGSTNDQNEALKTALEGAYGAMHEGLYVEDFGPDWVVFHTWSAGMAEGHYYRADYAQDPTSGTTFGQPVEVERGTTYVPVSDSSPAGRESASSTALSEAPKATEGHGAYLAEGDAAQKGADHMKTVIKALKLAEDADEATVLAEVVKLGEQVTTAETERDDARLKLAEAEKAKRAGEVAAQLKVLSEAGKITPAEEKEWLGLAETNPAEFAGRIAARETLKDHIVVDYSEHGSGKQGSTGEEFPDASLELAAKSRERMTKDSIGFSQAMSLVLSENVDDIKTRYDEFRAGAGTGKEG